MSKFGYTLAVAAGLAASLISAQASAVLICTTTTVITTSRFILDSELGAGVCVSAGDKTFGNFNFSTLTQTGGASVGFALPSSLTTPNNYHISFNNIIGASTTVTNYGFEVVVHDPTVALIDDLEKDFVMTAINVTGFATATLTGSTTPATTPINCTRSVNPTTSSCPGIDIFAGVSDLIVRNSITTGANTAISGVFDTISQIAAPVPEPASLALFGTALVAFGLIRRRRDRGDAA